MFLPTDAEGPLSISTGPRLAGDAAGEFGTTSAAAWNVLGRVEISDECAAATRPGARLAEASEASSADGGCHCVCVCRWASVPSARDENRSDGYFLLLVLLLWPLS